jgi:NNP family nitrate/nitrite transporter-like MFS transporter
MGWLWVDGYAQLLLLGALLGVAGASFAAALPLAGRWYPPQYQGLVMGIAGAGNSGTALATFFGPRLAETIGWRGVFGLAIVPVAIVLAIFALFAQDSPRQPAPQRWKDYLAALRQRDLWWFCFFYSVTFGGFVGLASFLNIFFHEEFGLSKAAAGGFATLCVVAGSFLRPLGGYLSDRFGGLRLLTALYLFVGTLMLGLAASPTLAAGTALMWLTMASLGMGNGAVFQLAPQRFSKDIGIATGLIGAAGGVGGFFLPTLLGAIEQLTGAFAGGFLIFALIAYGASVCLVCVAPAWERTFLGQGGLATNVAPPVVDAGLEFSPDLGSSQAS